MEYKSLSSEDREIRLLTLLEGSSSAIVSCTIEHVSLFNPPAYTALSYSWGNPDITKTIIINGIRMQATVNLEAGLRQLHAAGHSKVWADALCINQNDRDERSLQVNMMRTIYTRAAEVVVWLGIESEDSNVAMDYLKHQLPKVMTRQPALTTKSGKQVPQLVQLDLGVAKSFMNLFARPYWKRVWILQEVVAGRKVTLYCGAKFADMVRIEAFLARTTTGQSILKEGSAPRFELYRKDRSSGMPRPLLSLLLGSQASLATDPRDKVYALLGLSSDGLEIVPLPNYKQSLDRTFQEITLSILNVTGSLGVIALRPGLCINAHVRNLPSWVPDWSALSSSLRPWHRWLFHPEIPEFKFLWSMGIHLPREYLPSDMRSSRRSPPFVCVEKSLKLKGIVVDTIDGLSSAFGSCKPTCSIECRVHCMEQPRSQKCSYKSETETVNAIASSLCFGGLDFENFDRGYTLDPALAGFNSLSYLTYFNQLNTSDARKLLRTASSQLPRWIAANKLFRIDGRSLRSWIKEPVNTIPLATNLADSLINKFTDAMMKNAAGVDDQVVSSRFVNRISQVVSHGMRLMTTCEGWVGMAHPHAQRGDIICTIQGCSLPMILRKSGLRYQMVGEGYLSPIGKFGDAERWDNLTDIVIE